MNIVSAFDKTKTWTGEDPNDRGVCDNNSYLGNWITEQLRTKLPKFRCRIPDAKGVINKEDKPRDIKPYDLRHTWVLQLQQIKDGQVFLTEKLRWQWVMIYLHI